MSSRPVAVYVSMLIGAVVVAAGARWTVQAARRRPQLKSGDVMVLRRPRALGALVLVCGFILAMLLPLRLFAQHADRSDDEAFVVVVGGGALASFSAGASLIGDKVEVRMAEGQIVYRPVFGRRRQFHVSSVASVGLVPGSRWLTNDSGIGLFGADGRPLVEIRGVWRGTDHLLAWLRASRPGLVMSC